MSKWIAMSGSHGCIPETCEMFDSKRNACEFMGSVFELSPKYIARQIGSGGYMSLDNNKYGAEYIEIRRANADEINQ